MKRWQPDTLKKISIEYNNIKRVRFIETQGAGRVKTRGFAVAIDMETQVREFGDRCLIMVGSKGSHAKTLLSEFRRRVRDQIDVDAI